MVPNHEEYLQELLKNFEHEKDITRRHLYFVSHTTDPRKERRKKWFRAIWVNLSNLEKELLSYLRDRNIGIQLDHGSVSFGDMAKTRSEMMELYLDKKLTGLTPNILEVILPIHKQINQAYDTLVSIIMKHNN